MSSGALHRFLPGDVSPLLTGLVAVRFGLIALMAALLALRRKRSLFHLIVFSNAMFTLVLLGHTAALVSTLFGFASEAIDDLLLDVILMAVSNILIISIWY